MPALAASVGLRPVDPATDLPLLERWLRRPHVIRWWGAAEPILSALPHRSRTTDAVITVDGRDAGYLCWQRLTPDERAEAGLDDLADDLVDIDLAIGEPELLGRGIGPRALELLLTRLRDEGVGLAGLGTSTANARAIRAFEKAGFRRFREFHDPEIGSCIYLVARSGAGAAPGALQTLAEGRGPDDDGWGWLYRAFEAIAPPGSALRRIVCGYFAPSRLERARGGLVYRALGVPRFGRFLPTGGIAVRRATGARMAPYTLSATSLAAARDFYYRACVFEALHLPFLLALAALAAQRASIGRIDWAAQESVLNLLINGYPILHHRNTRRRIVELLARRAVRWR